MKKSWRLIILSTIMVFFLFGCGKKNIDYTDYFEITNIIPIEDRTENTIQVDYSITNDSRNDDLTFIVSIGDITNKYGVASGETKQDAVVINIGKPKEYNLSYNISYEVVKKEKTVWSKEDTITYDCTDMFVHNAVVKYGNETCEIQLKDYETNFYDLTNLFSTFDAAKKHNINLENANYDRAKIQETEDAEEGYQTAATGSVLRLVTAGEKEANDTYHYTDDLVINITDTVLASSVDWNQHMQFLKDSEKNDSYGFTTFKMFVKIDNPSDETVLATVTEFYVNDTKVSDEYLVGSDHDFIDGGEEENVYNISSTPVWKSTGETHIEKFGMRIQLEDMNENIIYDDIQWLYLE